MEILDAYSTEKKKQAVTPQIAKESEGLIDYQERRQGLRNPLSVPASTAKQSQPEQQEPQAVSIQQPQTGVMATSKGYQKVLADAAQYQTQSQNQFSGITVSPQEYGIITSAMARSDDPVKTGSRYAQALLYSRNYGIPVSNAYDNLDSLNTALTGRKVEYTPTGLQSVANSFKVGQLSMDRSDVASRWEAAYRSGNEALANQYDMQLQQIDAEMKALQDNAPRGLGITLLKLAADMTPYTARILLKGATTGAVVALAATGVGALAGVPLAAAGTLGGIGSAFSTASIYTAASAAGSWKAGYDLNRSSQYYDFIKAGIDPTAADWASSVGSSVSSGIETFLGEVPLISRAVSGRGVSKLTSKVMSRLALNGTWGALATGGVEYLMSSAEEGLEEVLQEFTDSAAEAAAYELSDKIAPKKSIPVLKRALQAGLAGFGAALVMGGLPAAVNAKVSVQDAKYLNQEAAETPSREAFVKNHMEDASLSGLEEKERKDALSGVWEKQQAKASAQETPETKAELSAVDIDEIDQPENIGEKDENGNEIQAIPSRYPDRQIERMVDGRLRTQEARKNWPVVNSDGSETHMLLLGSMGDNRRYGNIRYTMDGSSTIRIDQVQTRPGYDEIVADGIKELGRRYEGYDIQWDPEISSQQAVMTKLISDNPRGSDKGLNWYDPLTDTDEAIALGKLIKRRFGNLNRDESTVAAQLLQLAAKSQGKKVNQWLVDNVSSFENADMGAGRKGGIEFKETEQGIRATIYAAENADFSTFAHETFHLIRHTAGNSKELATALQEASRTADFAKYIEEHNSIIHMSPDEAVASVQSFSDDGKWTVAQEELAATMFESYLKDNSTASPKLKNLFQKIADWFGRIYQKIRSTVKMDDRVVKAFDEMLAGNPELAKTIQNQNRESTETILNQMDDSPESQYAAIEAKYKNTDQWLKAPNSKATNLNERQWVQVRTPSFLEWFGDWMNDPANASKVVDENGEPKVVYHNTNEKRTIFDINRARKGVEIQAFFFAPEIDPYGEYGKVRNDVFLNIKNPADYETALDGFLGGIHDNDGEIQRINLQEKGFDGGIMAEDGEVYEYFVFESNQIKSATDNVGTFDGENPNILFQEAPSDYQPKSTGIGYKVFVQKDGKLYPPMVANPNGEGTPVGKWLLADEAPIAAYSKTGRPQVKSGGKGTQGKSGLLAYRPGWHLGEIPYAKQFNRLNHATGNKELFPKDFVWAEVEYSKDNDYNEEARQNGVSKNGGFNHAFASLHRMPTDGFYNYRTNPDPTTDPWVITGAMKVNKILTREEVETIVKDAGREPQKVEGDNILYQTDDSNESNATVATAIKTIFGYDPYPQGRRNGWDYANNRSVNASIAYDDGAKPDHLWTKAELSKQYARLDLDPVTRKALESLPRNEQQKLALKYEGWHHTGRNFRKTEFYSFDEEAVRSITIDDVSYAKERIKLYKLYSTRYNLLKMIPPQFITASYTQEGSRAEKHGYLKANHFYPDDLRTVLDEAAKTIESNTDPEALEFIKTHGSNAMNVSQSQNVYADGRKPSPWDYQNGDFFKNGDIRAKTIFNDNGGVIGFVLEIYSDGEFIPYKDLAGNVEQSDIKSLFKFLDVPNPWAGDFIDAASIEDFQIIQDTDSIGGLYQTEDEYQQMVKEAEFFFSFKEFASYWKTMYDENVERSLLEKAYEESQRVDEVELERLLYPPAKGFNKQMSDEQKDEELSRQIDTEEGLDKFMSAIRNLSNFNWRYLGGEIQGMGKEDEIEHNIYVRFETEASPFLVAMAKSTKDLTDISKKQIRTTIKNNIRMYRDLYAEILHDPTLEAANYDAFLPDIDEPISEVSKLSIMDRKRLSSRIEAEGLRRKILRGTETRKGDAEKVIVELDTQIANLKKDVQRNEMQQETLKGKLSASESAFFDKVLELRGARKALDALNRSVRKKIDNGSRVEAKEIAHRTRIQDKIDLLDKQINDWHEQNKDEKKALRIAATQKKNDAIEELKKQIREKETQRREARKVVEYKERLATAIVTKPSTAVDFEYAQKINAIRQLVDPNFRADHVNFNGKKYTLAEFRDFVNSSDNPLELTPYQLDRVTKKSLDEWTVAELEDMAQTVANLRQEGRQIWQAKVDRRQHEAEAIQNRIISTLLANPKYRGANDQPASSSAEARQEKRSMSTRIRSTMLKTLNMDRKAQMLDGGVKGAAFDVLVREKRDAQSEEYRSITAREQAVIDVMKSTGVTAKDLYELVPITVDGKIQKYSYSDMIYVINAAKETRNYQAVSYGTLVNAQEKSNLNHDDEAIKSLGDARYRQFVSQAEAYLADKPELMTVFNAIEDNLQGQAQRINDVLIREYNEPMQVENYYLPIYRQDFNGTEIAQQIQDDVFNRNAGKSTTAPKSGFKQTRIDISPDHQMPVSYDYFGTWMKSIQQQEHLIASIEYVRKLNRVFKNLGSRDLRSTISATYGDSMLSDIDQYMNEVANPQVFTDVQGLNDGIKLLRGNVYSAYLGYKTSSIVLQAISSPMPYLAEVNPIQLAAGLLKMTAHPAKTWQFITSQSSFMANRSMHPVIDQIKKQAETYTDPKVKRAYSNFLEFGMKGLEAIDRWAVAGGWLAVYDKKLSQMEYQTSPESMKAAAKYADEVVYETQPVGDITELSPLFKSKSEFANAFLQFQTALNVIWQNTVYDVPKAFKQKKFRKAIGLIAGYSLAGILLTAVMDGFDDDDDETDKLRKLIYGSFTQYTDAVPIIGSSIEDMVYSSITGEKPYQYPSSFLPAWDKIKSGVLQLTQGNLVKAAEKLGEGAALSLGLPISGTKEIMAMFEDGEFHPEALAGQRE